MIEHRRSPRAGIHLTLDAHPVYNREVTTKVNMGNIEVENISKGGLCFVSGQDFPIGFFFNTKIEINRDSAFLAVLRIVRKDEGDENFIYGCEFIGLADIVAKTIDELFV